MRYFIIFVLSLFLLSCATTPTGRRQLKLVSSSQMSQMGNQAFSELKKKQGLSNDTQAIKAVNCITKKLLLAMGENPSQWEIKVFKDDSPNAFALPGKNMGVHTGMLKVAKNQAQLAAVIGHEIGHVLADHGNERMSHGLILQAGMTATSIALGEDSKTDQYILAAIGIGAQFGVLLPFSRKHETEADRLGLKYMAEAGFDPREAANLWRQMKKLAGSGQPEFMSTHPSTNSRIKDLSALAPKYMASFKAAKKPNCGNW